MIDSERMERTEEAERKKGKKKQSSS